MAPQALIVFEHKNPLGNAPANKLFDRVAIDRTVVEHENGQFTPARSFGDFSVDVNEEGLPEGIILHRRI
jgi:CRISPR-associated protein Csd2